MCGSCGLQGISSLSAFSSGLTKSLCTCDRVFRLCGCRYSSFDGFQAPTDVMESGMSSTFCPHSASLVKIEVNPWGSWAFTLWRWFHPAEEVCARPVKPQDSPISPPNPSGPFNPVFVFFHYDVLVRYMVHVVPQRRTSTAQEQLGQLRDWEEAAAQ